VGDDVADDHSRVTPDGRPADEVPAESADDPAHDPAPYPDPVVPPVQAADPTPVPPTSPPANEPASEPTGPPDDVRDEPAPVATRRTTWDPREDLLPYEEVDDLDGDLPVRGKAWIGWVLGAALLVGLAFVLLRVFDTGDEVATDPASGATSSAEAPPPDSGSSDSGSSGVGSADDSGEAPAGVGKVRELARGATFEVPGTAPPTTDFDGNLVAYEASQMGDGNPATAWRTAGDATGRPSR
jgi:hypothetical protein